MIMEEECQFPTIIETIQETMMIPKAKILKFIVNAKKNYGFMQNIPTFKSMINSAFFKVCLSRHPSIFIIHHLSSFNINLNFKSNNSFNDWNLVAYKKRKL